MRKEESKAKNGKERERVIILDLKKETLRNSIIAFHFTPLYSISPSPTKHTYTHFYSLSLSLSLTHTHHTRFLQVFFSGLEQCESSHH